MCVNLSNFSLCFCRQLDDRAFEDVGSQSYMLASFGIAGCGSFTDAGIEKIARNCTKLKDISEFCLVKGLIFLVISWNKELTDNSLISIAHRCVNLKSLNASYC